MICPHGGGWGHAVIDLMMLVPFVGTVVYFIKAKLKYKEKKNGN